MIRIFDKLFTLPVACLVGVGAVALIVVLIAGEDTVQPMKDSYRADERLSPPLIPEARYTQSLNIPEGLDEQEFQLAVFLGAQQNSVPGAVVLTLTQGDHLQVRQSDVIQPVSVSRQRFTFSGFSGGPASLEVRGAAENGEHSPGLYFTMNVEGGDLLGPGVPEDSALSLDWFKIMSGGQKFETVFPNPLLGILWLGSFAGIFALAWNGMRPVVSATDSVNSP